MYDKFVYGIFLFFFYISFFMEILIGFSEDSNSAYKMYIEVKFFAKRVMKLSDYHMYELLLFN